MSKVRVSRVGRDGGREQVAFVCPNGRSAALTVPSPPQRRDDVNPDCLPRIATGTGAVVQLCMYACYRGGIHSKVDYQKQVRPKP